MRVIVAEDMLLTREGIVHLLSGAGVEVVGQMRGCGRAAGAGGCAATRRGSR